MSETRSTNTGKKSVFRLPISNTLGINAMQSRAKLKNFALRKPAEYAETRNGIYIAVVQKMVEDAHETIWNLLADGSLPGGDKIQIDGEDWSPKLPDAEVGRLANGYSESMMNAFEEIMTKILPDDYRQLADDKMLNISKVEAGMRSRVSEL